MKKILLTLLLLATTLLSGCGFHLRSEQQIPKSLHTLYFKSESPYNPMNAKLRELLTSLNIQLVDNPKLAHYTLKISSVHSTQSQSNIGSVDNDSLNYNNTDITDTTQAVNYNYNQNVTASVIDNKTHRIIVNRIFTASATQIMNINQVQTVNTTTLATRNLPYDLVSQIYLWLTTNEIKHALDTPYKR